MNLADFRTQYPQYAQVPDGELAYRLWDKHYKGKIAMGEFADKVQLPMEGFGKMIEFAKTSGYEPTAIAISPESKPEMSVPRASTQGFTFGLGDELEGAANALGQKLGGNERPFGDIYREERDISRAKLEQYRDVAPVQAIAAEIAGSVTSPVGLAKAPAAIKALSPMARAAVTAGVQGAAYGFGSGEGGIVSRAKNAIEVGIPSALFGAGLQQTFRLGGAAAQKISNAMRGVSEKPSIESLRGIKNAAYQAVDDSGLKISKTAVNRLIGYAEKSAAGRDYVPEVDRQTFAALKMLESKADQPLTIGQLDKLRQGLYKRYNASGGSEIAIRDMIDGIDDLIASIPETDDLMKLARVANGRYKKAELLDEVFRKAELQTASTGSGGNILNKYKQAVTGILTNEKNAKWFTPEEIAHMESFVKGTSSQNLMRLMGKLSPSGNGLMLALNVGAAAAEPSMLALTAVGSGAKAVSDASAKAGANKLQTMVATGAAPPTIPYLPGVTPAIASSVAQSKQANKK